MENTQPQTQTPPEQTDLITGLHVHTSHTYRVFHDVFSELEAIAATDPPSKPFLMSPSEAKFIAYLITRHGSNYKVKP